MGLTLALAGDTMLGRGVADVIRTSGTAELFAPELAEITRDADLFVLNLECCISDRGERWPDPDKAFFFRAPSRAVEALQVLGVDCVTLANNHALDFGRQALVDTLDCLSEAGITAVGAGRNERGARASGVLEACGIRVGVLGLTDHPADFAAGPATPGVAYADLRAGIPTWVTAAVSTCRADVVVVTPHWGPNMVAHPVSHVRRSASALVEAGATLVAGSSAHIFQGVTPPVLWDLGDFIDDYAIDPVLRNNLGLLWLVTFDGVRPVRLEAVPLGLDFAHTRLADESEAEWIADRFRKACAVFSIPVGMEDHRLVVDLGRNEGR